MTTKSKFGTMIQRSLIVFITVMVFLAIALSNTHQTVNAKEERAILNDRQKLELVSEETNTKSITQINKLPVIEADNHEYCVVEVNHGIRLYCFGLDNGFKADLTTNINGYELADAKRN